MPKGNRIVDPELTSYSHAVYKDAAPHMAMLEFLAPTVNCVVTHGKFNQYLDEQDFQTVDTRRALGGRRNRIGFNKNAGDFNCDPHGLEIANDDFEETEGAHLKALIKGKTRTLVNTAVRSHVKDAVMSLAAQTSVTGGAGNWSDDAVDPIEELNAQIKGIGQLTEVAANRVFMDWNAAEIFWGNKNVKERKAGLVISRDFKVITPELLGQPEIKDFNFVFREGAGAKTKKTALPGQVWVFYASPTADQYDASYAKTFRPDYGGGPTQVKRWREEGNVSDMYAVDWGYQVKVVSPLLVRRLIIT